METDWIVCACGRASLQGRRVDSASGILVCWIVNPVERQIEVYTSPTPTGYDIKQDYKAGEKVPIMVDGLVVGYVTVSDVLR